MLTLFNNIKLRQTLLASKRAISFFLAWIVVVRISSLLSFIEILYYLLNFLYSSHSTFPQVAVRLCISLLALSLFRDSNLPHKIQVKVSIRDNKPSLKDYMITGLNFILLFYELNSLEDTKHLYLAQHDRDILILDIILEAFWRFLIMDFMGVGYLSKLLQIVLSARLVSFISKNELHFGLRTRFILSGALIGMSLLGLDKLKDICGYRRLGGARGMINSSQRIEENEKQENGNNRKFTEKFKVMEYSRTENALPSSRESLKLSHCRVHRDESILSDGPKSSIILNSNAPKLRKEYSMESSSLINVLDYLPEGVIVLDLVGNIRFINNYMSNIFELEKRISLKELSESLSDFKFREASIQFSGGLSLISKASSSNTHYPRRKFSHEPFTKLSRSEFLYRVNKITSLEELFSACINDPGIREVVEQYVPTFQTRYHQQSTNEWFSIEIKVHMLPEDEKYFIILLRDITERENKLITLEKEKTLYRDNLIASFSHELRTPLNANLAFLEQSMDSPEIPFHIKRDLLKPALDSGRLLFFMVSDILDYSLMILNKLRLEVKPQNIIQTVNQCLELFRIKAIQKKLRLKLSLEGEMPPVVYTDHKRVSQVLTNLLSNAVQFTTEGEIEVIISKQDQKIITITVRDTGIGMEKSAQERLERTLLNEILKEKLSEASVGIGLGLFISNKLVKVLNAHGETGVKFLSEYGRGSRFYFDIENREPRVRAVREQEIKSRGLNHGEIDEKCDLSNKMRGYSSYTIKNTFRAGRQTVGEDYQVKALIVDDEIFNIIVIENYCKSFGILTEKAFNGKEAIEKLRMSARGGKPTIKVVFMDVNMPVMDGYESTIGILKMMEMGEIEDVVVIGVTAYVSRDMIDKCLECGMAEVLNKPLSKEGLMSVLKKYKILR